MARPIDSSKLADENGCADNQAWAEYQEFLRPLTYDGPKPVLFTPMIPEIQTGYPDNNPKTTVGMKKIPLDLVPPSSVHALATAFADGARKYGPYNWRNHDISSSVYYAAALRHIQAWWDGEETAADSGVGHIESAMACLAILVDARSVGKLNDNRPPKGAASRMQEAWLKKNEDGAK